MASSTGDNFNLTTGNNFNPTEWTVGSPGTVWTVGSPGTGSFRITVPNPPENLLAAIKGYLETKNNKNMDSTIKAIWRVGMINALDEFNRYLASKGKKEITFDEALIIYKALQL